MWPFADEIGFGSAMARSARQREPRDWRTRRGALNYKPRQYIRGQGSMAMGAAG